MVKVGRFHFWIGLLWFYVRDCILYIHIWNNRSNYSDLLTKFYMYIPNTYIQAHTGCMTHRGRFGTRFVVYIRYGHCQITPLPKTYSVLCIFNRLGTTELTLYTHICRLRKTELMVVRWWLFVSWNWRKFFSELLVIIPKENSIEEF